MKLYTYITVLFFLVFQKALLAENGDTLHVYPFQKLKIYTDPSDGKNEFSHWGTFPNKKVQYRKILLNVTFQCPDSLHCGEWDYEGNILVKRTGGKGQPLKDLEIARIMTPYGWRYNSSFKNTWTTEITDFGVFLHDSIEIEYVHFGYENKDDRGWLVTLDFEIIEGTPIMNNLGFEKLWNGRFIYGDSLISIEDELHPMQFQNTVNASIGRMKIIQSGHGMDSKDNCAEFCPKLRQLHFNTTLLNERKVWKECGDNPLYPQAGTWIYDRANWCPGSMVVPENFEFKLEGQKQFMLDFSMEEYKHNTEKKAFYSISSYLFYYSKPTAKNDVAIEQIIRPSNSDEFSRFNPVAVNSVIRIKNNGLNTLRKVKIYYGVEGCPEREYKWKGSLKFDDTISIALPIVLHPKDEGKLFYVRIEKPNNKPDEYIEDNKSYEKITMPEKLPENFVLEILTNDSSQCLSYSVIHNSLIRFLVKERVLGSMLPNTIYRDTFDLDGGNYEFLFTDSMGVGLDFWAMPEAGYGYIRFYDMNGKLIKNFNSDFGNYEYFHYTTTKDATIETPTIKYPMVKVFPYINNGNFNLDFIADKESEVRFKLEENSSKKIVYENSIAQLKSGIIPFNITNLTEGRYTLYIYINGEEVKRSMIIEKKR